MSAPDQTDPQRESLPPIPDATEADAALDICNYVADMILKRELSEDERHALTVKAKFWFRAGAQLERNPVRWNPGNKVVQDHRDGTIILSATDAERAKRGLPTPWTPMMGEYETRMPDVP